jgi:hypothetical protein
MSDYCCRKKTAVVAVVEVNLEGLMGEINKLVIVLSNGIIMTYDSASQTGKTLADTCTRLGRAERAELLEEVEREMGYVEEKLKQLRRVRTMLLPAQEIGDGH